MTVPLSIWVRSGIRNCERVRCHPHLAFSRDTSTDKCLTAKLSIDIPKTIGTIPWADLRRSIGFWHFVSHKIGCYRNNCESPLTVHSSALYIHNRPFNRILRSDGRNSSKARNNMATEKQGTVSMGGPSVAEVPNTSQVSKPLHSNGSRVRIAALLDSVDYEKLMGNVIRVCGWSRTVRKQGGGQFCFVSLSDGSTTRSLQVVVGSGMPEYDTLLKCGVGCSFGFKGEVVESPADGQAVELAVNDPAKGHLLVIYGVTDQAKYPLSKKQHSREFLREHYHLRPRTFFIGAVARVRSNMAMACHKYFQDRGFLYVHTPIITASDCEGAGEMFQVTTMFPNGGKCKVHQVPVKGESGNLDFSKDFFGKPSFLTVSGQLECENYACALGDVYTFGPTFRAENSHTSRHLAEFWMIEPEMAFADLEDNMLHGEGLLKYCVQWAMDHCMSDLEWFEKNQDEGLIARLKNIVTDSFERLSYTDAVEILKQQHPEEKFSELPEWGMDLGSEHERFLCEKIFKKPVIIFDYPKDIKSFYMKMNDDFKTVRAMDIIVPKIGEVIGGSQREDNLERLDSMIEAKNLNIKDYSWYRDLRAYGTVPHAGYGMGFERLLMLVTGVENIRDVIPFPRYPGHC